MGSKRKLLLKIASRYRNRVRQCRFQAMVATQEDLSRLTGINRSTISALENNRLFLSSQYALLIAEALGCKLDNLFEKRDVAASGEGWGRGREPEQS